jgi:hypothetical protein
LFGTKFEVLLYDLTNIHFEADPKDSITAKTGSISATRMNVAVGFDRQKILDELANL